MTDPIDVIRIGEEARQILDCEALQRALAAMFERTIDRFRAATCEAERLECQASLRMLDQFEDELKNLIQTGKNRIEAEDS